MKRDSQLNVYNIKEMLARTPQEFDFVRFDPNNDCNLHCVYCHNHRSKDIVDTAEFREFLEHNIIGVENFQLGCIMEPTLDPRLCDLMLMIAHSRGKPRKMFFLQTNGILLHRHDLGEMRDAGLTHLYLSIDSADPATLRLLRGGTSISKVHSNVVAFQKTCPSARIIFITTVTSLNIHEMDALVAFGLDLGVEKFILREVFYNPENDVVDHSKMPGILLKANDFSQMKHGLIARFGKRANFVFADAPALDNALDKMKADSGVVIDKSYTLKYHSS
jgi:MoaA/NifB/PqqE/SkfB family radical SAM enzyme